MMYGEVAVVGTLAMANFQIFDASTDRGLTLYQDWVIHNRRLFRMLATTVPAATANRDLRNMFRTRSQLDCVAFLADEECADYTNSDDVWLALTHWSVAREVSWGATSIVRELRWCAISSESFEKHPLGYKPLLYPNQTASRSFSLSDRGGLESAMRTAHAAGNAVVIVGF